MSRLEWILGIVLLVLLVVVIGLALSLWLGPETNIASPLSGPEAAAAGYADDIAPTRSTPQQTAKNAYVSAQKAAQGWQEDAVLVSATATWPQGVRPCIRARDLGVYFLFTIQRDNGRCFCVSKRGQLIATGHATANAIIRHHQLAARQLRNRANVSQQWRGWIY